jgi:hypothetical protein
MAAFCGSYPSLVATWNLPKMMVHDDEGGQLSIKAILTQNPLTEGIFSVKAIFQQLGVNRVTPFTSATTALA